MFRGSFDHNIDEKGRVAIPSTFRKMLVTEETGEPTQIIVTNFDKCLVGYPLEKWEELEGKLASLPQFDPKVVAFQRYYIAGATECQIDKAGRILLPANLRDFADIDRSCVIVGNLAKFEIWSKERWEESMSGVSDSIVGLAQSLTEMGLSI